MASALSGSIVSACSTTQSLNQPAAREARGGKAIWPAATFASSAPTAPVSAIAASTSRPRAAAAAGFTRGLMRDGARGSPASTAACHKFT